MDDPDIRLGPMPEATIKNVTNVKKNIGDKKEEEIIVYLNFLMEIQIYKIRSELGQLKLTIGDNRWGF